MLYFSGGGEMLLGNLNFDAMVNVEICTMKGFNCDC